MTAVNDVVTDEDAFELPEPEYRQPKPTPFNAFKKGTRQPSAPKTQKVPPGELPWWATAKRDEMTKAGEARQTQMSNSKEGLRTSGSRISFQ